MNSIASISAKPVTQVAVPPPPPGSVPPGTLPLGSRIDFRSLLREDALAREPVGMLRDLAGGATALAPSIAPQHGLAQSLPSGSPPKDTEAGDSSLAALGDDVRDPLAQHRSWSPAHEAHSPVPAAALAAPAPQLQTLASTAAAPAAARAAAASLEDLLPAMVRRVAWSGDGKRGSMRMELGAGELAGATLTVHADNGRVRVHLDVPPGVDASGWQERLRERLDARGIATDSIEVT
jgi:hypothetical protein